MKKHIKSAAALTAALLVSLSFSATAFAADFKTGSRGSDVAFIQTALKYLGFFNHEEITGYYGEITTAAVFDFQEANSLEATGTVNDTTYELIKLQYPLITIEDNTPLAAPSEINFKIKDPAKTGSFDWFKVVEPAFSKGTTATVLDISTGKSFQITRTFGHLHADIEPVTKRDAAIIREVWGGKDSWDRRAVVVMFGDYIIAGSMVGYAHAGKDSAPALAVVSGLSGGYGRGQNLDAVKDNDFNGVTCLHFLNSKIHGRLNVDKKHQSAVEKAAKYINDNFRQ